MNDDFAIKEGRKWTRKRRGNATFPRNLTAQVSLHRLKVTDNKVKQDDCKYRQSFHISLLLYIIFSIIN